MTSREAPLIGLYPGTFDPFTAGHRDILRRAAGLVDRLILGVAANAGKGPIFTLDERVDLARTEILNLPADLRDRVEVRPFSTLLMDFAVERGVRVIIRGLRAISDFEYEFQMAGMNARINPTVETAFLMASERTQFVSSRFVKEICALGGDVSEFVSPVVLEAMRKRLAEQRHGNDNG